MYLSLICLRSAVDLDMVCRSVLGSYPLDAPSPYSIEPCLKTKCLTTVTDALN
jgi:hypothetical protein